MVGGKVKLLPPPGFEPFRNEMQFFCQHETNRAEAKKTFSVLILNFFVKLQFSPKKQIHRRRQRRKIKWKKKRRDAGWVGMRGNRTEGQDFVNWFFIRLELEHSFMLSCWVFLFITFSPAWPWNEQKSLGILFVIFFFFFNPKVHPDLSGKRSRREKSALTATSRPSGLRQSGRMSLGDSDRLSVRRQLQRELLRVLVEASQDGLFKLPELVRPLLPQPVELLALGDEHLLLLPSLAHFNFQAADQIQLSAPAVLSGDLKRNNPRNK